MEERTITPHPDANGTQFWINLWCWSIALRWHWNTSEWLCVLLLLYFLFRSVVTSRLVDYMFLCG